MLPPNFKNIGIDMEAIESIGKEKRVEQKKENAQELYAKLLLRLSRIEMRLNTIENSLNSKINEIEEKIKLLDRSDFQKPEKIKENNQFKIKKRNNPLNSISPEDVRLDKIFNFSNKKF